jgi:hypothetical protein
MIYSANGTTISVLRPHTRGSRRNADEELDYRIPRGYCCFGAQMLTNDTAGTKLLGGSLSSQKQRARQPQDGKLGVNGTRRARITGVEGMAGPEASANKLQSRRGEDSCRRLYQKPQKHCDSTSAS